MVANIYVATRLAIKLRKVNWAKLIWRYCKVEAIRKIFNWTSANSSNWKTNFFYGTTSDGQKSRLGLKINETISWGLVRKKNKFYFLEATSPFESLDLQQDQSGFRATHCKLTVSKLTNHRVTHISCLQRIVQVREVSYHNYRRHLLHGHWSQIQKPRQHNTVSWRNLILHTRLSQMPHHVSWSLNKKMEEKELWWLLLWLYVSNQVQSRNQIHSN